MNNETFTPEEDKQVDPRFSVLEGFLKAPETRLSGRAWVEKFTIDNVPADLIFPNYPETKNCDIAVSHGHGDGMSIKISSLSSWGPHMALEVKFKDDGSHTEAHYLVDGDPVRWDTPENQKPNVDALIDILVQSQNFQPEESGDMSTVGGTRGTYGAVRAHIYRNLDYKTMYPSESEKSEEV